MLLHSFVLKIAAAVWQFPLNFSTCPKTGTLCVKVGPKPAFIPLSNSCIQSYNSPGLLVEYIINMQQDPNALFSQSLGVSSNSESKNCATVVENCLYFYFSDHDLCLLFNEGKPRCQRFDLHKISKSSLTWSLCQVYGSLLANQSEPSKKLNPVMYIELLFQLSFLILVPTNIMRWPLPWYHTVVKTSTSNRVF